MFWCFMFVCNMIYSVTMIVAGWFMWKHSPKEINSLIGYRTKRSRLNHETWKFAQEHCGKRWWRIGWMMLIPTILVQIPFYGQSDPIVGNVGLVICTVECTVLLLSVLPTEKALKRNFTDAGERR